MKQVPGDRYNALTNKSQRFWPETQMREAVCPEFINQTYDAQSEFQAATPTQACVQVHQLRSPA
jgi:hypothetical protein